MEATTDQELVSRWAALQEELKRGSAALYAIERELRDRMLRTGASEISHPNYSVKLRPGTPSYDLGRLLPLLEIETISPQALSKAYFPAYQKTETVPARWDGRGLNELRKLGGRITEIIDGATFRADPKLEIKPVSVEPNRHAA